MATKKASGTPPPRTIEKALRHAVEVSENLSRAGTLDEETLTGAVLGSLSATLSLAAKEAPPEEAANNCNFFWARYNKGTTTNPHSEATNGADFALVLIDDLGKGRLAIFQAKKGTVKAPDTPGEMWTIDVHRVRQVKEGKDAKKTDDPAGTSNEEASSPEPQLLALIDTSQKLLQMNAGKSAVPAGSDYEVAGLSWVHYVAYSEGKPICLPVDKMAKVVANELLSNVTANLIEFSPDGKRTLFDILISGIDPKTTEWLLITNPETMEFLPKLLPLVPVIAVGRLEALRDVLELMDEKSSEPVTDQPKKTVVAPEQMTLDALNSKLRLRRAKEEPSEEGAKPGISPGGTKP